MTQQEIIKDIKEWEWITKKLRSLQADEESMLEELKDKYKINKACQNRSILDSTMREHLADIILKGSPDY